MNYALLWALIGWGLASWVIVLLTLPDPPPDAWSRFIKTSIAGIIGGLIGGSAVRGLFSSDPMPGLSGSNPMPGLIAATIVGAAAGALVIAGASALIGRGRTAR